MKNIYSRVIFSFILIIILFGCSKKAPNPGDPEVMTTLNLDTISNIVTIPLKIIWDGSSETESSSMNKSNKNKFIQLVVSITSGPDSTIYVLDYNAKRIVQLTSDGVFIRSIGGPGSGPGEFLEPTCFIQYKGDILIPDKPNGRIQIFDSNLNYKREIKHFRSGDYDGRFAINDSSEIFTRYSGLDSNLVAVYDNGGKLLRKFGELESVGNTRLEKNFLNNIKIIADRKNRCIWCIYEMLPIIKRYDFYGKYLEKIIFASKDISDNERANDEMRKKNKMQNYASGIPYIPWATLLNSENIAIDIIKIGNCEFNIQNGCTKISKLFKWTNLSNKINEKFYFIKIIEINNRVYGFKGDMILKSY
jgi:hypothetical protein